MGALRVPYSGLGLGVLGFLSRVFRVLGFLGLLLRVLGSWLGFFRVPSWGFGLLGLLMQIYEQRAREVEFQALGLVRTRTVRVHMRAFRICF